MSTIELAALGRPFQLGMLYDCRRDVLIPGITLWDSEMLKKHINVCPQPNTDFKIIASDSSEAKSEALNVSASLEASFLGGLVSVKGSRQSRVSLQYRTTTRFEQLTMDHLGAGNVKHCNVFQEGSSTHVVTALHYGASAFFVFDQEVSSGENHQDIQGNLQATIKKIPLISIEGQGNLEMSDEEKREANKFNCTFHGDFALENNPVTFEDAIKVYAGLPHLLGENGEHAVPMTVWLYPLKNLDSAAAQLVRQISVSQVRRAQRLLDGLDNTDVQCQDMMKEDMAIKFPEFKAKLNKFRDLCSEYKQVFQKGLCKVLPNIRGGGMEEEELIKMLNIKERSPFQNDLMITYLDDREREMNVVSSYLDIMKEVQVVYSSSELDGIVLDQANDYVVCFALSFLKEKEEYLVVLENYLLEESKNDFSLIPYNPNAAGKTAAEKWFRSGEVTTLTRQTINLFLDFKESNKDRENLAFCIASIPNKFLTASSIHVYERGTLLTPQFELPSKPGVLTIKSLEVYANCGETGNSLPSPETVLTTLRVSDAQPKTSKSTGAKSQEFLTKSQKVEKGKPSIHWLNLEQKLSVSDSFDQYTFGRKVEQGNNKVILLLGATGAGKTTLVSAMINYILGVKWEDCYRFKLIHEVTNRSQAESQTVVVTSYELYNQPGFQIPYSVTVIDTPGFGDTRGMAHDKLLIQMLKDFLCNPLGIDHIDAVCFVVQASLVRLSPSQRYIFDSILSIFGKDVAENILMLVTFVDGKPSTL
uniref:AIG1-type G domain-containing protein n=1 Tax=Oncorhynchus mykiss TaxID=8022 RepID=A0A8C7PI45_ONCMY